MSELGPDPGTIGTNHENGLSEGPIPKENQDLRDRISRLERNSAWLVLSTLLESARESYLCTWHQVSFTGVFLSFFIITFHIYIVQREYIYIIML
jgi:hypothetical protein